MSNIKFDEIKTLVNGHDVVLFMKGTADAPMCGFSAFVARGLHSLHIPFKDVNVLMDEELRQAIKDYSEWPTIPQLYVKGEFIGGCDIFREMVESGEFTTLLQEKGVKAA